MAKPLKSGIQAKNRIIFIHIVLNTSICRFLIIPKRHEDENIVLKKAPSKPGNLAQIQLL